jgi:putative transposase
MKKRFTEEQITYALRQNDAGKAVAEICREMGVSEQAFYRWRRKYAGLGVSELKRLRMLEDECGRLKRLVADLSLDKHILQEAIAKKV